MRRGLHASAVLGRDLPDRNSELLVCFRIHGPMPDLSAGGVLAEKVVACPVSLGSERPRHEAAPAVRAHVAEHIVDARSAERALVGTDARVGRVRRQRRVAVLAGRPELEHGFQSGATPGAYSM